MTLWVGDVGSSPPVLHVLARSEPNGIDVDWDDAALPTDDLSDALDALRLFLEGVSHQSATEAQVLPPQHPHVGELHVPGHPDEHRFLEVRLARVSGHSGWSEPPAAERERGVAVQAPHPLPGHKYMTHSVAYGTRPGQPGEPTGPAVTLAALVAAIASEIERRA